MVKQPSSWLLSTAYAPPSIWMALLLFSEATVEAQEHFQKQTHRNRTTVLGPNGPQILSIPVMLGSKGAPIKEVRISYTENWQQVHWRSLEAAYGNAPFWEYLRIELAPLYQNQTATLWNFNKKIVALVCDWLQAPSKMRFTNKFEKPTGLPNDQRFQIWQTQHTPYPQVFAQPQHFQANLSVFDLIFNLGPQAYDYLEALHRNTIYPQFH